MQSLISNISNDKKRVKRFRKTAEKVTKNCMGKNMKAIFERQYLQIMKGEFIQKMSDDNKSTFSFKLIAMNIIAIFKERQGVTIRYVYFAS